MVMVGMLLLAFNHFPLSCMLHILYGQNMSCNTVEKCCPDMSFDFPKMWQTSTKVKACLQDKGLRSRSMGDCGCTCSAFE